jgi:hypothetical protein
VSVSNTPQEVGVNLTTAVTYTVAPRWAFVTATRRARSASETIMLAVVPHGGQRTARRNALSSVRADAVAARDRAEALAAMVPAPAPLLEIVEESAAS